MAKKLKVAVDISTEEKIKAAATKVFMQKGYAATRTRDIAEAAEINLALLNYYFRSKEKLFEIVMLEKVQKLFGVIMPVITDETMELEKKIELIVANYIDMLIENQDLPIFVLSEIRNHPDKFANRIQAGSLMSSSSFVKQLHLKVPHINPMQFLMSIIGMTIFPFIGKPIFQTATGADVTMFNAMMQERKKLIPLWVNAMLATS
jgi:AcrR family transcriptional regulator